MPKLVQLRVNGRTVSVPQGTVLAAAIAMAGVTQFRRSVSGAPRGPVCGMGVCMECRVTINCQPHCRSCQTPCEPGMEVQTDDVAPGILPDVEGGILPPGKKLPLCKRLGNTNTHLQ